MELERVETIRSPKGDISKGRRRFHMYLPALGKSPRWLICEIDNDHKSGYCVGWIFGVTSNVDNMSQGMCKLDVSVEFKVKASLLLKVEQMIVNMVFIALSNPLIQFLLLEVR
jgi:hypothetical protein